MLAEKRTADLKVEPEEWPRELKGDREGAGSLVVRGTNLGLDGRGWPPHLPGFRPMGKLFSMAPLTV